MNGGGTPGVPPPQLPQKDIMTTNLLSLRAENFKRLTLADVQFDPTGGVVAIMGQNEAGKSSLLDALEVAIAGRKGPKIEAPVHTGADSSRIVATFDDIVVTRTYKPNGDTKIEVKAADGRRVSNAEELLRSLYSHVALDPLAFSRLDDKTQVDTLLPLIGFDPVPLDKERDETFELRTVVNRDVKAFEARLAAMPDADPKLPADEISVTVLSDELVAAERTNARRYALSSFLSDARARITRAHESIALLEQQIAEDEAAIRSTTTEYDETPEKDVDGIRQQIVDAEGANQRIRAQKARTEVDQQLTDSQTHADELTRKLADIKDRKEAALAAAKMPVPGLSIDDESGVLTLAGVPFSQASTGVKIRTGTAIAMALNPDLRLIVIRDASLLDAGNRSVIDELAKANGFTVLMEIADESMPVGVVIEEGTVREVRS